MCSIDLDPCEAWSERERHARKDHKCSACRGLIRRGEVYVIHFNVFEGEASWGKMCGACKLARNEFAEAHEGMLMSPDSFRDMLAECISEGDEESDQKWAPMLAAMDARREARNAMAERTS